MRGRGIVRNKYARLIYTERANKFLTQSFQDFRWIGKRDVIICEWER